MENESEDDLKPVEDLEVEPIEKNPDGLPARQFEFRSQGPIIEFERKGAPKFVRCEETAAKIRALAAEGISKQAVATLAGITLLTLKKRYNEDYVAGQGGMEVVVARAAMEQVRAGNPQMIMFVAKTKLGWSEHNVLEHTGTVQAVVSAKPLSKEEFAAKFLNPPDSKDE